MSSESEKLPNSSGDRSCGDYFELLKTRNELEKECIEKLDLIQESEIQKKETCQVEAAMKFKCIYEEYVSELADKLDFFEIVTEDLLEEFRQRREMVHLSEKTISVQQQLMEVVEHEKAEKESKLNTQIEYIESKFISKCEQLFDIKSECEVIEKELEESQKVKRGLELDVTQANFELYRYLCKLKAQQQSLENSEYPKVTQSMIDDLQNENENLNQTMRVQEESIRTLQDEIRDVDEEIKTLRTQTLRQYRIEKQHSEWKNERMSRDISDLQAAIRECSILNNSEDPELKKLRYSLELMRLDCLAAEKCLTELDEHVKELEREPIFNCDDSEKQNDQKKVNEEIEKIEMHQEEIEEIAAEMEQPSIILGRDYLGSIFVKAQEELVEQDEFPEDTEYVLGRDYLDSTFVHVEAREEVDNEDLNQ